MKKGMGLLLVVMAFWFVRPGAVLPAAVFYPLAGAAAILTAVFMGAFDRPQESWGWWPRTRMALGLVVFVAGLWLLVGSFLAHGFLPSPLHTAIGPVAGHGDAAVVAAVNAPRTSPATITASESATPSASAPAAASAEAGKVAWEVIATGANASSRLEAIRAAAREAGQPVLVDFWASWCVYCKKLDKSVWNDPAVVAESQRWATVKIDATATDDDEMAAIKAEFQVTGLPRVIFIDSRGAILHAARHGLRAGTGNAGPHAECALRRLPALLEAHLAPAADIEDLERAAARRLGQHFDNAVSVEVQQFDLAEERLILPLHIAGAGIDDLARVEHDLGTAVAVHVAAADLRGGIFVDARELLGEGTAVHVDDALVGDHHDFRGQVPRPRWRPVKHCTIAYSPDSDSQSGENSSSAHA